MAGTKYRVIVENEDGERVFETSVRNGEEFEALGGELGKAMPGPKLESLTFALVREALHFDSTPSDMFAVRQVVEKEFEGVDDFDPQNFELIVNSPDVVIGRVSELVMLRFLDGRGRSYVLPIGESSEITRIASQIRVGAKRVWGTPDEVGTSDAFLFHGELQQDSIGRWMPHVSLIDDSAHEHQFRFTPRAFAEFCAMVSAMLGTAQSERDAALN
jgi:hypothetical protein